MADNFMTPLKTALDVVVHNIGHPEGSPEHIARHPGRGRAILEHAIASSGRNIAPDAQERVLARYEQVSKRCESPIERELAAGMLAADWGGELHIGFDFAHKGYSLIPQLVVASYRLDFAVRCPDKRLIGIECDGRDYHNREDDHKRDQILSYLGIPTLRFTGQEIRREPISIGHKIAFGVMGWVDAHD